MLQQFARGYLHQDLVPEYGKAMGAAKSYVADLSGTERKALAAESRKMLDLAKNWKAVEIDQQLRRWGAACRFDSPDEFRELLRWFERTP